MWTNEQLMAINKEGTNIIVSAGAGSGKTAVLTERVIRKLINGVNINELLILTFTNAASQEMKERIRDKISKIEGLEKQLDLITTAYICTFDSYSLSLVKKYHYLLNIDSNVSIMDNNINFLETKRILDGIFEKRYNSQKESFCNLVHDYCVKNDEQLKSDILNLFLKIDLLVEKQKYLDNYFDVHFSNETIELKYQKYLDIAKKKIKNILPMIDGLIDDGQNFDETREYIIDILQSGNIEGIKSIPSFKRLKNNSSDYIKKIKDELSKELKKIQKYLGNIDKEEKIRYLLNTKKHQKEIISIIKELDCSLLEFKQSSNTYTFMDIAKMAIRIVKENEDIREEIKNSLNEIMIDEYQDTSDIQEYFINLIANNNVYMVGDIKQSIYRFRHANPYLFQTKYNNYKQGIGGFKIDLTSNFRSRRQVVNNINNMFSPVMNLEVGGADYQKDHIMNFGNKAYEEVNPDGNYNSDLIYYENNTDKKLKDEEIEAFIIAKDIKNKVENKYQVMDKQTREARCAKYSDFVILMNKSKNFDLYKKVFNYFQIPLNIYKDEQVENDHDIKVVLNILKLIVSEKFDNFGQEEKYQLTSILRSYLFEYSDEKIFDMFYENNFYNNDAYNLISDIRKNKDFCSIQDVLTIIDDQLGILYKSSKIKNIKKVLVHLEYLSKLAKSLSELGYNLSEFVNYLSEVFENNLKIEYQNKLSVVDDAVKVMTIHKSKGLEFAVCYFPLLNGRFNADDMKKDFIFEEKLGIIIPYSYLGKKDVFLKEIYKSNEKDEMISEQLRVLYVAVTRTKEKMIFVTKQSDSEYIIYKTFNDFLLKFFNNITPKYISDDEIKSFIEVSSEIKSVDFECLKYGGNEILVSDFKYEKHIKEKKRFSKNISHIIDKKTKNYLQLGTQLHEALERIDFVSKDKTVIDLDSKYHHYIDAFLNSHLLNEVNKANVFKEYQFFDEQRNVLGSIDLMLEYETYIDIIDYKMKNIDDEEYINQLNGYKDYIERKTGKVVNIYLYSILDKRYKEL